MNWASAADFNTLLKLISGNDQEKLQSELALRNRLIRNPKSDYWSVPLIRSEIQKDSFIDTVIQQPVEQSQMTSSTTDEAIKFIEKHAGKNPFFAFVTYAMPHVPLFTSEPFDNATGKGIYTDVVAELDNEIGRIKQTLKRLTLDENTLLIFTSDNGPWLAMGDHGGSAGDLNNGKGTTFEGGVRVPTIFWSPERITPAVIDDIGLSIDFFKTLLGLSGKDTENMEVNIATDSIDLSATLLSNESDIRNEFVYYHQGEIRAMRVGKYKAHFITQGAYNQPPEREVHATPLLFDLVKDPGETKNIANQHPEVLKLIEERRTLHEEKMTIAEPLFDNRLKQPN
jgi:arylsulfatase A-like enzyme